ncbi:hypothetical protein IW261DRAFT_1413365 [Armillaria novae-zelandiae]|uniref:HMG box domain-containing protein n=1 Tax=Armillaria novae-zelandiae TaxID=153914 RepID=A0AA39PVR3_9AGAR|nr:hypothetical protein IW261DRAFT_1413365 [Armillaria novae-zelandiae]
MQKSNMPSLFHSTWSFQDQRPQGFCSPPIEELSDLSLSGIRLARSARNTHAYDLRDASDVAQSIGSLDVASIPNSCTSTPYVHSCATLPALDNNSMTSPPLTFLNTHLPTPRIPSSATLVPPPEDEFSMTLTPPPQDTNSSLGFYHTHTPTPSGVLPTSTSTPEQEAEADIAPDPATEPKIPRPPNAFILFRSDILKKLREKDPKNKTGKQRFLSQVAGEAWRRITPEERQAFNNLAEEARADHLKKYPNYRFSPQRKGSKKKGRLESDRENGTGDAASISHFVENVLGIQGKAIQEKPFQPRRKRRPRRSRAPTSQLDTAPSQSATAPTSPATSYSTFELGLVNPLAFNPHSLDLVGVTQQHISPLDSCATTAPSLPSIILAPSADYNATGLGLTLVPFSPLPQTSLAIEIDNATSLPVTAPASPVSHHSADLGPTPAPFIPWSTMPHTSPDSFDYPADHPFLIAPRRPSSSQGFFRHLERGDIISRSASTVPAVFHPATVHDHVIDPYPYTWSRPHSLAGDCFTLPSVDAAWDKDVNLPSVA